VKKKRPRTLRRRVERATEKLEDAREKLARVSVGGSTVRPIEVASAAVIEPEAIALGCARCEGEVKLEDHDAVEGLRRVRTRCKRCGHVREVWLRIASRLLS
jgi:hypothetical protein